MKGSGKNNAENLKLLQKKLDYQFSAEDVLERAITHRSYHRNNNERLEFLGDSILGFVIAEALYEKFPKVAEGDLTKMRARLVRGSTLADVARDIGLSDFLLLGEGELKSGGFNRDSILSDAVEAILGAVYLDGGFVPAKAIVLKLLAKKISVISPENIKDSKTMLQELLQKHNKPLPNYAVIEQTGKPHELIFKVQCEIENEAGPFIAVGNSRRIAEQNAAKLALALLNKNEQ